MTRTHFPARRQSGTALLVALMVLLVVTVIGLSLASAGRIDLMMVSAYQSRAQTSEFAQAAIDRELSTAPPSLDAPRTQPYADTGLGIDVTVTSSHSAITDPPQGGYSQSFAAFHYKVTADALGPRDTALTLEQGYYLLGPAK